VHLWQWNLEWISPRLPCYFIQCVWSAKFDLNLPCCLFCVSLLQNDWTEASEVLEWSFQAAIKVVIDSWNLTPWVEALSHNGFNSTVQTVTTQLVLLWQQYKSLFSESKHEKIHQMSESHEKIHQMSESHLATVQQIPSFQKSNTRNSRTCMLVWRFFPSWTTVMVQEDKLYYVSSSH